jgi:hypothetical protein
MRHSARVRVLTSNSAAAQAQGVGRDPLEPRDRGLSPLDPKESALLCLYRLIPRYGPCSVVGMRFLYADTHLSAYTKSDWTMLVTNPF